MYDYRVASVYRKHLLVCRPQQKNDYQQVHKNTKNPPAYQRRPNFRTHRQPHYQKLMMVVVVVGHREAD